MSFSQSWLEDQSALRHLFVEVVVRDVVGATEITKYLSTTAYATTDASLVFDPILKSDMKITESISLDGGISMSVGDIPIHNINGDYDSWLDATQYIWNNRSIKVYYGDPYWDSTNLTDFKTKFLLIFDGIVSDIDSRDRDTLNLKIRDKLEKLNIPVTENKLGTYGTWAGGQQNQDSIKPLIFGEVHNIQPLLTDPSLLEYMFNDGPSESLIEIRDNGVPIYTAPGITGGLTTGATVTLSTGKFTLNQSLAGDITVSVQGVKNSINLSNGSQTNTYNNNIASIIALITTQYGRVSSRLTVDELDLDNLNSFGTANTQAVGVAITDRENVLSICQALAESVGAQLVFSRAGKLQLIRLGDYTGSPVVTTVTDSDIVFNSGGLSISRRSDIRAATKIGYCKNWTVQQNLLTGIPEQHKDMFRTEWYKVSSSDNTIKTNYKLFDDAQQEDTYLIAASDASAEATRRNNYFKQVRTVYKFKGTARLLSLILGQQLTLIHNRFNLYNGGSGRTVQVVGLSPDWLKGQIDVEVAI